MLSEAVAQVCSVKNVFLEILQNSQENPCARVPFFNKVAWQSPTTSLKKRLRHRGFTVNFAKFLRTLFLTEQLRWLHLCLVLETARVDCSPKNLQPYLNHLKIEPIYFK